MVFSGCTAYVASATFTDTSLTKGGTSATAATVTPTPTSGTTATNSESRASAAATSLKSASRRVEMTLRISVLFALIGSFAVMAL